MEDCAGDCYKEISITEKTVRKGSFFYMENHWNEHLDISVFYFIISSKMKYSKKNDLENCLNERSEDDYRN